jgi:hypothetical protein
MANVLRFTDKILILFKRIFLSESYSYKGLLWKKKVPMLPDFKEEIATFGQ